MITPLDILSLETWLLIISIFVLIRLYIYKKWQVFNDLNIPHETPSIFGFGNMGNFMKDPDSIFDVKNSMKKKLGLVYGTYMGLDPRVVVHDPEILKQVYIKEAATFRERQTMFSKCNGKVLNTMLSVVSGDQWKRIRNTLSPTFSTSKLKGMFGIVEECADKMVSVLQEKVTEDQGKFDIKDVFGRLSIEVMCATAFSTNVHCQGDESEIVNKSKQLFSSELFRRPLVLLFMFFPWTENIAEKFNYSIFPDSAVRYYERLIDVLIKQKKQKSSEKPRVDIMQLMLESEITEEDVKKGAMKGLTRTELVGNSVLMILAGYETTTNAIIFLAYCLAQCKDIQKKVQEEVDQSTEKFGGLTYECINNLKYLDMCMKESQRLYGAIPSNSRYTDKEITINGLRIPAHSHVHVPVYELHHDEDHWEQPWQYRPERFEDMSKIDPMIFQPFGAGPRNCIGMRFAIMEVKMAMCKILQKFNLEFCEDTPAPPLKVTFRGSMQPKETVYLKVTPRSDVQV